MIEHDGVVVQNDSADTSLTHLLGASLADTLIRVAKLGVVIHAVEP